MFFKSPEQSPTQVPLAKRGAHVSWPWGIKWAELLRLVMVHPVGCGRGPPPCTYCYFLPELNQGSVIREKGKREVLDRVLTTPVTSIMAIDTIVLEGRLWCIVETMGVKEIFQNIHKIENWTKQSNLHHWKKRESVKDIGRDGTSIGEKNDMEVISYDTIWNDMTAGVLHGARKWPTVSNAKERLSRWRLRMAFIYLFVYF